MAENNSFFWRLIFKSIHKSGIRSFVIFISIMLGSAVCAAFVNVYADIDKKVSSELNSYGANMIISPKNLESSHIDENALEEKISKIKGLKAQNKYIFGTADIGSTTAVLMGVEFSNLKEIMPFLDLKKGRFINVDFDDKNALIGEDLAKLTGLKVGDTVEISKPNSNDTYKLKIKGIVFDGQKEDGLLLISLNLAQEILNAKNEINYAELIVNGSFSDITKLSKSLSDDEILFEPVGKVSKAQGEILDKIKLLMALIGITIMFITSVCINTSLSSILLSRLKEFALIRAIGASKKNLLNIIITEVIFLCLIGALAGVVIGYFLAILLGHLIFSSGVEFRFISLVVALLVSLVFALIASYYPIKKALNPNLANLLRE